jgi:hypothetical protein
MRAPLTVLLNLAQTLSAGQQLSLGRQRQLVFVALELSMRSARGRSAKETKDFILRVVWSGMSDKVAWLGGTE